MTAGGERGRTAMRAAAKKNGAIRARLLTFLALLITAFATATPAARAATSTDTQAAYLAAQLRTDPVYVTDQLPREIPQSTAPDFAKLAQRTGVPTYVLVLPAQATTGVGLLDAVHDRLGKDGLYVLIDESTVTEAKAYGVQAPAEDAATVAFYELPYDAGPLRSFERFADAIAQGAQKAATRAETAREKYGEGDEPADLYIGPSDRENQSTLTGAAITGVPLLMLLLVPYVRRWWRRRPGAAPRKQAKGRSKSSGVWILAALALATAVAITLTAPLVFDQTRSSASPPPRAIDLNARLDRVAKGLAEDPVYADPESPRVLDTAQMAQLHSRIEKFSSSKGGGPVFVALVPQIYEDESQGDEDAFAAAVRDKLGGKDGVYIVADPLDGYIDVFNHGLGLDTYSAFFDLPESISYGDSKSDEADDHLLGERLDDLMVILDKTARTDEPTTPGDPYPVTDPIAEDELRPLFYGEFWSGLFLGVLAALLFFGLAAAVLGIVRRLLRRRNPEPLPTSALPQVSPAAPSLSYLRETATTEIRAMTTAFGTGETADARSLDRYEATMVLVDEASAAGGSGEDLDVLPAAALVVIIVLARATRAALADDDTTRCCGVNPLHGPAKSSRHVRVSTEGNRRKMLPLCDRCLNNTAPNDYPALLLTLPGPDDESERTPYYQDDLLSAAPEGYTKLVRKVRESTLAH
ncbi:hypothetical protein OG864_23150 [Streptomyces sp. NBC_00124]|uniref:hypothetical protein n=1 Tax=Streptomyces sp. NBC_00124 TaxID=2975662 RepID=UPI0022567E4F|nr:hypothetical protein [Streptomyces sp. NBC_00124]MCX5361609.1 hypothetical protein [Streptomyces sp. NBC_00124]